MYVRVCDDLRSTLVETVPDAKQERISPINMKNVTIVKFNLETSESCLKFVNVVSYTSYHTS